MNENEKKRLMVRAKNEGEEIMITLATWLEIFWIMDSKQIDSLVKITFGNFTPHFISQ